MCKVHYWEPIYRKQNYHGKEKAQLYGICAHCKKVVRAETLMKRLNAYERECREAKIEEVEDE